MKIIQLGLKDCLFSKSIVPNSNCETIKVNNTYISIRNDLTSFLIELSKYFRIGIWSKFEPEIHEPLVEYIKTLGINVIYSISLEGCINFTNENCKPTIEKRLKRLNCRGFKPSDIIAIEIEKPLNENYRNHIIVPEFNGYEETDLFDLLFELIPLEKIENTQMINQK